MTTFLLPTDSIVTIDAYLANGIAGAGIRRAHELGPNATIDLVTRSGLRGRGGGGFPTGQKWAGVAAQTGGRRYLVCNGAEGEPGTFKDRALLRANPYQLVEGVAIAAFAIGAVEAFICLKASFRREIEAVTRAVQEFQTAGLCGDCKVTIVAGPDEYLFGEEKAMLEVIEGNEPLPRWLPPYTPAGGSSRQEPVGGGRAVARDLLRRSRGRSRGASFWSADLLEMWCHLARRAPADEEGRRL